MPSSTEPSGDKNAPPDPAAASQKQSTEKQTVEINATTTKPTGTTAKKVGGDSKGAAAAAKRARSSSRKPGEAPTLLHDFLLGRPSPARLEAERKRRASIEAVKAELRHEMKQSQVRKLQPPNGVRERVKAWQKANASATANGNPEDAGSEPTDLAFAGEDFRSVTEEDRVRIKMRLKKRGAKTKPTKLETEGSTDKLKPPKKRIVSDDNWVKPKVKRVPSRKVSPRPRKASNQPRMPSGYVFRSVPNPSFNSKVKSWAENVEAPDARPPSSLSSTKSYRFNQRRSKFEDTKSEGYSDAGYAKKRMTGKQPVKPKSDDGIRVRPMNATHESEDDEDYSDDDYDEEYDDEPRGRSRSTSSPSDASTERPIRSPVTRKKSKSTSAAPGNDSILDLIKAVEEATELSRMTEDIDDLDSYLDSSARDQRSKSQPNLHRKSTARSSAKHKSVDRESNSSDETFRHAPGHLPESELAPSLMNKSVADIPGDIPFGHSAFSELDLSLKGSQKAKPKPKPKADRSTSLKGMPNILKKVVEEGKKMMQEMNEPPRHAVPNNPPSIEKWLSSTVDALADGSEAPSTPKTAEPRVTKRDVSEQSGQDTLYSESYITGESSAFTEEIMQPVLEVPKAISKPISRSQETLTKSKSTSSSGGLRRSRATRGQSQSKPAGKRPLLGVLKQAFQGESSAHAKPIKGYKSHEERKYGSDDDMDLAYPPSGSDLSSWMTENTHSSMDDSSVRSATQEARLAAPRLRPPTNGNYELSTILSEEDSSTVESDLPSNGSQSTLTQSTAVTRESSGRKPERQGSGLKRRLTKHSDLVSVLSVPDDRNVPQGIKNSRSRPSLRKARKVSAEVTNDDLLKEFADDENLYQRELKTLVDGVVPVLLSHVVDDMTASELFGPASGRERVDGMSKSVVNMGVALEKLKKAHAKAPLTDIRKLANWGHGVVPIYHNYLSAWRLGFQDLVVNLAPRGEDGDEDSLLDALPRDEHGDIVNSEGERVPVAYLLKRPLIRVKQMAALFKCIHSILGSHDTNELVKDFEDLQEKSRRRHREELARMTDEEAVATDKTRARDLRTLSAARFVSIDPSRQVSAKDIFSLDLLHSNGQRLECQVEFVHRDKQNDLDDEGDILVREIGDSKQTYLLFPPISLSLISARPGDGKYDIVVMIRGSHNGQEWFELLNLYTDDEEQILDWLDIIPDFPVPPREPEPSIIGDDDEPGSPRRFVDVPVGAQSMLSSYSDSEPGSPSTPTTPRGSSKREPKSPASPSPDEPEVERTPTQKSHKSRPLREDMRPDPEGLKKDSGSGTNDKKDTAPPLVPVHRTLSPSPQPKVKSQNLLKPPVDLYGPNGLKRRGSSPLKHEYLPSEASSASGLSAPASIISSPHDERDVSDESESDISESESSDDDLDSLDIPQTELGFSIRRDFNQRQSVITASECSLTPSNSASQAGLYGPKIPQDENVARYMASISRWNDKGQWKDIGTQNCSIVVTNGLIEAYTLRPRSDDGSGSDMEERPLLALDLTPLVLIRQSTAVDLEIRSSVQPHCRLAAKYGGGNFRFRCFASGDCYNLYMAVHHARLHNEKFIQLENESRFKSFGERTAPPEAEGESSTRSRSWFGRKNSYRSSVRAPSQSNDATSTTPSTSLSATSFLRKLTLVGNLSFNLARSSIDKHGREGRGPYQSASSSGSGTPRSPSVSVENSGSPSANLGTDTMKIRLHLLVTAAKWEDFGNCTLQIRRPPPGWHQALRADHGLEKRVTVTTIPRKEKDKTIVVLDAVLGSGCFSPMGSRGIVCGVWEEIKGDDAPATGPTGGNIKKWCFQFGTVGEANWVLRLVHQEVVRA